MSTQTKAPTGVSFRELDLTTRTEVGFVYKSILGSFQAHAGPIPKAMYHELFQGLLDRLIKRPGCIVVLAVHPDDLDFIFGFAVLERYSNVLHYLYVKSDYRRSGIGAELLHKVALGEPFSYTHSTPSGRKFLNSRKGKLSKTFVQSELP